MIVTQDGSLLMNSVKNYGLKIFNSIIVGERLRYDSNGNQIEGNTGQWQLTAEQVKAYLKDPTLQIKDGNWGNEFTTYNWTTKKEI